MVIVIFKDAGHIDVLVLNIVIVDTLTAITILVHFLLLLVVQK